MGKKLTIILGAGASYDVVSVPVTKVEVEYRPPLADELFQFRPPLAAILDRYPRARALAATIVARVSQGESVEGVLREVRDSGEEHLVRQFRHVPLYLSELFHTISGRYTSEPANYTHLMNRVLGSDFDKVAFVTLNYDLFLENSLRGIDGWQPSHADQYATPKRKWMLIKLHGSANWGRRVLNVRLDVPDDDHALALIDKLPLEEVEFSEIEITDLHRWATRPHPEGGFYLIYPSLTVPVAGKYEYACPEDHVQALREFLATCENFLIIGVSGKDQDLLDLLNENVATCGAFAIVGGEDVDAAWARFHDAVRQFRGMRVLLTMDNRGFSEFIRSGELDKFLGRLQ